MLNTVNKVIGNIVTEVKWWLYENAPFAALIVTVLIVGGVALAITNLPAFFTALVVLIAVVWILMVVGTLFMVIKNFFESF